MPTKKSKFPILLQAYISVAFLYFTSIYLDYTILSYIIKPLPVLLLVLNCKREEFHEMFIHFGLICSIGGDTALMFGDVFFVIGLASFLIAHIFYAKAFSLIAPRKAWLASIPYFAYVVAFLFFLIPYTGEMRSPVVIYSLAIAAMLWRAYIVSDKPKYKLVFLGALTFTLSDTILAINRFYMQFDEAQYVIMVTYWAAQYLIAKPFLK
jgi:uncharacterized membrane protein YhhN